MQNKPQKQTVEYNGTEYTVPRSEEWEIVARYGDKNQIRVGPKPRTENRARTKHTRQGVEVRVDDVPLGRINSTGCFLAAISREQVSDLGDLKDVASRNTFDHTHFEVGTPLYKTAEDDNTIYLSTTKPNGFVHEEPTPVDELEPETTDWTDAEAAAGTSEPTSIRVDAGTTVDDLKVGERYYAVVNNTDDGIGVWVSLPDMRDQALNGLAHRKHHKTDLTRLKKGDALHVTLRSIDSEGRAGFTIVHGVDTMNDIDFVDSAAEKVAHLDDNKQPMKTPDVDPQIWKVAESPDDADAEFENIPDAADIKAMSTDEFLDHLEHTSVPETFIEALEDQPDNFEADPHDVRRIYEMRHTEGSLAHTFAAADGGTESYADMGDAADDAGLTIEEAAEPDITQHYADSEALKNNAQAIFQTLRQTGIEVDPADYIRQKFAELDDEQQREFVEWAANSEIPDDLFRKLTRELL